MKRCLKISSVLLSGHSFFLIVTYITLTPVHLCHFTCRNFLITPFSKVYSLPYEAYPSANRHIHYIYPCADQDLFSNPNKMAQHGLLDFQPLLLNVSMPLLLLAVDQCALSGHELIENKSLCPYDIIQLLYHSIVKGH